eukprot:CAMPEP_0168491408 /NCGR_PEP_ID=MMETSP0228-20121227/69680_1 /TAXON_ID=133427 /ORGANISM="Protoceratium reticulatum, Strain CCCM 535 (=CCMP 1889)" /LENGTH=118 /DNA_ID=CAMNT_0008508143 /DNA_START=30 /DNA_END=383 /DNA_ORIENTATION=+
MEDVPLCVIHPRSDEIIPPTHGQAIYEQSKSSAKFGVWLCNASHNLCITEDHLQIAHRFLGKVLGFHEVAEEGSESQPCDVEALPELESTGDFEAEECWNIAEKLMRMGASREIEEQL